MRRIIRKRFLTKKEADKDDSIRKQIAAELPELIARHHKKFRCPNCRKILADPFQVHNCMVQTKR